MTTSPFFPAGRLLRRGSAVLTLTLAGASGASAQMIDRTSGQGGMMRSDLPDLGSTVQSDASAVQSKDYVLPALEIIGFDVILNRLNHRFDKTTTDYNVTVPTIKRNISSSWVVDNDPYNTNQIWHPYQGAMYHGFARSSGMNYWESLGYTFAGSAFWEVFGEATRPSRNDQIASGIAGSFLGESLFRLSSLVLENGSGLPSNVREVAAAAISPPTGFNRLAFGNRFDKIFASNNPAYYGRLQVGVSNATQSVLGPSVQDKRTEVVANFAMDYGLPGKNGYRYERPFDYFNLEATGASGSGVESIHNRGLLIGRKYELGNEYRGIWGLYGSYDYIAPQLFRVSSTALSLGSTAQWWLSNAIALQGTATAGIGYAAAGSVRTAGERDYNYGVAPQALVSLRMILADAAAVSFTAREYFVSNVAAASRGGHENIIRADASVIWRVHQQHALALKYLWSHRDASYPGLSNQTQSRATVGLYYTLLAKDGFGSVDWR